MVIADCPFGLQRIDRFRNIERFLFQNMFNAENEALSELEKLEVGEGIIIFGFEDYHDLRVLAQGVIASLPMDKVYNQTINSRDLIYKIMREN